MKLYLFKGLTRVKHEVGCEGKWYNINSNQIVMRMDNIIPRVSIHKTVVKRSSLKTTEKMFN